MRKQSFAVLLCFGLMTQVVMAEDDITVDFGGRLQLDYAFYNDDVVDRDDGGEVRRVRLFAKGEIGKDWDYKVQFEFADDDPELRDGYVRYKGLGAGILWLGNYKQPAGLEVMTSSNTMAFMERGLVTAVGEGRRIGIGYQYAGDGFTVMGSAYGDEANGNAEGEGIIGRATFTPVNNDDLLVHLGASAGWSETDDGTLRIRVRPDSHVTDDRILDTGTIENVDDIVRLGLEGALVMDRFSAQAEYLRGDLARSVGSDLTFDGWYIYGSYFLTPDQRSYSAKKGAFASVDPSREGGAWEVGVRFATLNLTDADIMGGEGDALTFGVNWFTNKHLRFSGNYSIVDTDEVAGDDDPSVFQVRMQVTF